MSDLRDNSKGTWTGDGRLDHINAGSLQRIADAVEKVALRYDELLLARKYAEESRDSWQHCAKLFERRNRALRGVITKLRARLATARLAAKPTTPQT
ncbi:hypothetical protein [Thiocapsa sp. N5-Cardenillas]|uniref:hypothetical protein n=1 Tax=Thiocapsa sp. N5-Cardenillas TaxID=3137397 RepID=UPI0035B3B639